MKKAAKKTKYFEEKKFKTRGKQRLFAGGADLIQNQKAGQDPVDEAALGALGSNPYTQPFAALAQVGIGASKSIRGDATDLNKNTAAEFIDPFGWAKGNENAGDLAKSLLTPFGAIDKAKRKQQVANQNKVLANSTSLDSIKRSGLKKGGYIFGGNPPDKSNPFAPFSLESWKKQGVLDSLNRGTMIKGTYADLNKHFKLAIPQGVNPQEETYFTGGLGGNPSSLEQMLQKKQNPVQFHTIMGDSTTHDKMGQTTGGSLMTFRKGGKVKIKKNHNVDPFLDSGQETTKSPMRFGGPVPTKQQKAFYTWWEDETCDEDYNTKGEQRTYLDPDRSAYGDKKRSQSNHSRDFLASGGQLLAKKLDVLGGGELEPISNDAVEVKANNPQEKDSVELKDAFVDNNEVIDRKNRVFSAELGYASIAKKLEKQKNKDPRFKASNERIEEKLDDLFRHQEESKVFARRKGEADKSSMAAGGRFRPTEYERKTSDEVNIGGRVKLKKFDPTVRLKEEDKPKASYGTELRLKPEDDLRGKYLEGGIVNPEDRFILMSQNRLKRFDNKLTKASFEGGGNFDDRYADIFEKGPRTRNKERMAIGGPFGYGSTSLDPSSMNVLRTDFKERTKGINKAVAPKGLDNDTNSYKANAFAVQKQKSADRKAQRQSTLSNLAEIGATYGPNLAASILQNKLKGPAAPTMEYSKVLDRVRPDAQLAAIDRDALSTEQLAKTNTAQAGDLTSAYGNILAKKLAAQNQVYGQNQALNAEIQGREAALNIPIQARNVERTNQYNQNQRDFSNMQQRLTSENIASVGEKYMLNRRQKNLMDLDKFKFGYAQKQFEDSGVGERAYNSLDPELKSYYNKFKAKGGFVDDSRYLEKFQKGMRSFFGKDNPESIFYDHRDKPLNWHLEHPYTTGYNLYNKAKNWLSSSTHEGEGFFSDGGDLYGKYLVRNRERAELKKGGTIHINPKNKGKFNALKKRTGKTTEQLKHSKNPLTRKRATFAQNAKHFNHKKK